MFCSFVIIQAVFFCMITGLRIISVTALILAYRLII